MTTLEILRAARALIAQPGKHCKGYLAVNAKGNPVDPNWDDACQFCSWGAVHRFLPYSPANEAMAVSIQDELDTTARSMGHVNGVCLNDTTDLPTVLAMFDATIARLESQGESR